MATKTALNRYIKELKKNPHSVWNYTVPQIVDSKE